MRKLVTICEVSIDDERENPIISQVPPSIPSSVTILTTDEGIIYTSPSFVAIAHTDLILRLEDIIYRLGIKPSPNMAAPMNDALNYLTTYQQIFAKIYNSTSNFSTFYQVPEIIRQLRLFDISRKGLLDYLKRLCADLKAKKLEDGIIITLSKLRKEATSQHDKKMIDTILENTPMFESAFFEIANRKF